MFVSLFLGLTRSRTLDVISNLGPGSAERVMSTLCLICPGCRQLGQKTVEAGCAFPGPDHVLSAGWGWCGVLLFRLLMLPPSHTLILLFRER